MPSRRRRLQRSPRQRSVRCPVVRQFPSRQFHHPPATRHFLLLPDLKIGSVPAPALAPFRLLALPSEVLPPLLNILKAPWKVMY